MAKCNQLTPLPFKGLTKCGRELVRTFKDMNVALKLRSVLIVRVL